MSGYKRATITLTRDEYDRLHESADKLRALPEISHHQTDVISQQSIDALRKNLETIENRQVVFRHLITDFNGQIRTYEENNSRRFAELQSDLNRRAEQNAGRLWDRVTGLIADQERNLTAQLTQSRLETQVVLESFQEELNQIVGDEQRKISLAEDWLAAAETLLEFVQDHYACELFLPGRLDGIQRSLFQARQNLDLGLAESAIISLQQSYFTLSDMHQQLEKLQNEWQMMVFTNWETANQILAIAESSDFVQAVDLDGNPLPFEINIGYWSDGALERLIEKLNAFLDDLVNPQIAMSLETLHAWREKDLPSFYKELEDIVLDARIQAINSQLRINIADLVVCALSQQGFHLEDAEYRASDERQAYTARLTTLDGSEVIVMVEPKGSDLGENELQLRSLDREQRTEHELQQRWTEISRSLTGYGLSVGSYVREDQVRTKTGSRGSGVRVHEKVKRVGHPQRYAGHVNGD